MGNVSMMSRWDNQAPWEGPLAICSSNLINLSLVIKSLDRIDYIREGEIVGYSMKNVH